MSYATPNFHELATDGKGDIVDFKGSRKNGKCCEPRNGYRTANCCHCPPGSSCEAGIKCHQGQCPGEKGWSWTADARCCNK